MAHFRYRGITKGSESGAVLAIALLLMTALTLLAVGASQLTRTEGAAVGAVQKREAALQRAEAALACGERLLASTFTTIEACTSARCRVYSPLSIDASTRAEKWWRDHAWVYTEENAWVPASDRIDMADVAVFVIEELESLRDALTISPSGQQDGLVFYRLTAFSRGTESAVVLQSTVALRVP